jgi:hypothetical protein
MEEKYDEHSKGQRTTKIIDTNQIVASKEALINMMSQ